jgi:hypothetical protein
MWWTPRLNAGGPPSAMGSCWMSRNTSATTSSSRRTRVCATSSILLPGPGDYRAAVHLLAPDTTADRSDPGSGGACRARRVRRNCDMTRPPHKACPSQQVGSSHRASGGKGRGACGSWAAAEGSPDVYAHILAEPRAAPDDLQRPLVPCVRFRPQVSFSVRLLHCLLDSNV